MKETTNPQLLEALNFDPIAEAERVAGQSYKENEDVVRLGMGLMHKQRKEKDALLFLNRDTVFSMTFAKYCERVEEMGFRKIYEEKFDGEHHKGETFAVWWHPEGLLLTGESYGESHNIGKVYFNFQGPRNAMHQCSSGWGGGTEEAPIWSGDRDTREGLRFALDEMRAKGAFLAKWATQPFLWLLNYMEMKPKDYNYAAINARKIAQFPPEVREAIAATAPRPA